MINKKFNIICESIDDFRRVNSYLISKGYNWTTYGYDKPDIWKSDLDIIKKQFSRGRKIVIKNYTNGQFLNYRLLYDYYYNNIYDEMLIYGELYTTNKFLRLIKLKVLSNI